ncbi:MAG: DUF1893 domain-containing protein [Planctomycetota bacterium]
MGNVLTRLRDEKLTIRVERDGVIVAASDRPGLKPLQELSFQRPDLLDGSDAALPIVGLAAAYLLIYGKVGRVFAETMTKDARNLFREEGIEFAADAFVRKLPPDESLGEWDPVAKRAVTLLAFVEELKRAGV